MRCEHEAAGPEAARIRIEGLRRRLTLLHLTDSHMAEGDARDPEAAEAVVRFQRLFEERTPGGVPARELFARALRSAAARRVDALALTGDIVHFPAWEGLDLIRAGIDALDVPAVYTCGNHDWHFPHTEWGPATRAAHYPRFHGLTGGQPACGSTTVGGVRLLTVDDSIYQVDEAQVEFLRTELASGDPCLLFTHIPLDVDGLRPPVMEKWQAPIVVAASAGWTAQTRQTWRVEAATAATRAFHDLATTAPNLAAVFCGHVHFAHADALPSGAVQYVTAPGFEGGCRWIELLPLA